MLHSSLLHETVQLSINDRVLILNSAADPFVLEAPQRLSAGELILAEDNLASLQQFNNLVGADVSRPSPIMNVNTKIQQSLGARRGRCIAPIADVSATRTRTRKISIARETRSLS